MFKLHQTLISPILLYYTNFGGNFNWINLSIALYCKTPVFNSSIYIKSVCPLYSFPREISLIKKKRTPKVFYILQYCAFLVPTSFDIIHFSALSFNIHLAVVSRCIYVCRMGGWKWIYTSFLSVFSLIRMKLLFVPRWYIIR